MSPRRNSASPGSGSSSGRRSPRTRTEAHPKTSREQFSACGACKLRRVRCDLKELPILKTGRHPSCTNCRERGLKCVDEYAQVKSVKLLRRGRRLQQAEALYGKVQAGEEEDALLAGPIPPANVTPMLKPEFFDSIFWRRFHGQRPVIEPAEFLPRFVSFTKGNTDALGVPGKLLAMSLVVWASSFGFNESGQPVDTFEDQMLEYQEQKANSKDNYDTEASAKIRTERKNKTNEMLKEMLYLIDIHGILRKPTWDGVRLLLMTLPLTQEVQSNMERTSMYESTLNAVHALSGVASVSINSGEAQYVDGLARARVFWFSIIHDWMVNGLRGGRMFLTNFDLHAFQDTLPPLEHPSRQGSSEIGHSQDYATMYRFFSIPLKLSAACKLVHGALTGAEARRRNVIDEDKLHAAWEILDKAWHDIDQVRSLGVSGNPEEVERYIASWQIFMFECNNIIREALKQRISAPADRSNVPEHSVAGISSPGHDNHSVLNRLYTIAHSKCMYLVQAVLSIIKRNLGTSFFQYDAFIVRDGVFFAGFLLASEGVGEANDVNFCLSALREMRWAFSKSEEREHTIRMIWQAAAATRTHRAANQSVHAQFTPAFTGPALSQQFARPTSLPRVDVSHLVTGSPAPNSARDEHWPPSAVSSGGSDKSSPNSYHSPTDPSTTIQIVPFTDGGYTHYSNDQHHPHFEQNIYPQHPVSTKSPQFDNQVPALYYNPEYHQSVTQYYPEEPLIPSDEPIPGPSNYQHNFYYNG